MKHGTKPGPVAYLDPSEEEELVNFLFECSRVGYGKTKREVLQMVEAAAKKKGVVIKGHISDGWWYHFCQRWPKVSLRKGDHFLKLEQRGSPSTHTNNTHTNNSLSAHTLSSGSPTVHTSCSSSTTLPLFTLAALLLLTQAALPLLTQAILPLVTQAALPLFIQAALPLFTQVALPLLTQATLPLLTQTILPLLTQAALPLLTLVALS